MLAFMNRHRRKLAITTVAVGAGYLAVNYVRSKLTETKERLSSERIARENLKRRFEQNQEDCAFTIANLLPTAGEQILNELPVEALTVELRKKKNEKKSRKEIAVASTDGRDGSEVAGPPPKESEVLSVAARVEDDGASLKSFVSEGAGILSERTTKSRTELWEEIKISSLTRSITLIYTLSLLTLLTHIQMNLLGRRNYLSSVASLNVPPETPGIQLVDTTSSESLVDPDPTHRQFLAFSYHVIHNGWKLLLPRVREAVTSSVTLTPRDPISFPQLHYILQRVRASLPTPPLVLPYLLPARHDEKATLAAAGLPLSGPIPPPLRLLLDETSDILESPHCSLVYSQLLNSALDVLEKHAARELFNFEMGIDHVLPEGIDGVQTKVANVLAFMTREAHTIVGTEGVNEYLVALKTTRDLEGLSAVIYSEDFGAEVRYP